jgi:hypothetical protein
VSKINVQLCHPMLTLSRSGSGEIECESASKRLMELSDKVKLSLQEVGTLGCLPADAQAL